VLKWPLNTSAFGNFKCIAQVRGLAEPAVFA
jgi:hypothetical protein